MPAKYNHNNNGITVDVLNLRQVTNYSLSQLYSLMGINAIQEPKTLISVEGVYPELEIKVKIETYNCTIARIFRFDESEIFNEEFNIKIAEYKGKRIGTMVFCSQVINARHAGFKKIKVWAAGNHKMIGTWNGYITWGKLGFAMDEDSQLEFEELMQQLQLSYTSLKELLLANEKIWMQHGTAWEGTFLLAADSDNSRNLKEYLESRKLNNLGYNV